MEKRSATLIERALPYVGIAIVGALLASAVFAGFGLALFVFLK
jgi:hypothetical protein